jgi:MFS family permease
MTVNYVGTGMFTPFLLIYLHEVRGFSLQTAGLVSATFAGCGMVLALAAGPFVDRVGARPAAALSLVLLAAGLGAFPLVREPWHAFALIAVAGVGRGLFWPGYSTLLINVTPADVRVGSFAVQRVTASIGFALGGLAAGLLVSTRDASTFTLVFLLNAATYFIFLVALAFVTEQKQSERAHSATDEPRAGYREVLRDRGFVGAVVIAGVFAAFGIAQLNSMLPLFANDNAGVSERGIGLIFVFNTVAILLVQLPVARVLEGRRRAAALALIGVVWAVSWLLALSSGVWLEALAATVALILVGVLFGVGECLFGVVQGPLVADLAPERLRGRYNAVWLTTTQIGLTVGPALGGLLLAESATALWLVAAGMCLACGAAALLLERTLPTHVRRTPVPIAS